MNGHCTCGALERLTEPETARGGVAGWNKRRANVRIGVAALLATIWWMLMAEPVLACPVCFGSADTPAVQGAKMAILALLGVTGSVLVAFAAFFVHLTRRARMTSPAPVEVRQGRADGRSD